MAYADTAVSRPEQGDPLVARMHSMLDTWEACQDGRCIFLRCYSMMSTNMLQAIQDGRFYDAAWVNRLLHHFGQYYFDALAAYDQGTGFVPAPWRRAHDLARGTETTVMENLLLGINAHINYDLALAIRDTLAPDWAELSDSERNMRYMDHCEVNRVIAETINMVQDEVAERYARLLEVLDVCCGPLDEWETARYITAWRNEVWKAAVRLVETADAAEEETLRQELEASALERAEIMFVGGAVRGRIFGYPIRWLRRLKLA